MTTPEEQVRAIQRMRELAYRMLSPYDGGFKRIPRAVRQEFRRALKHYPMETTPLVTIARPSRLKIDKTSQEKP